MHAVRGRLRLQSGDSGCGWLHHAACAAGVALSQKIRGRPDYLQRRFGGHPSAQHRDDRLWHRGRRLGEQAVHRWHYPRRPVRAGIHGIAYHYGRKHGLMSAERSTLRQTLAAAREAGWALGIPVLILGGIYGGIFTPTEAAAVAAVYAILVTMLVYREMSMKQLLDVSVESAVSTAQ